jgi:GAF domain-containing protein
MAVVDWLWGRVKGAFDSWVERLIWAAIVAAAYASWRFRHKLFEAHVSLPTWVFVLILLALVTLLALVIWRLRWHRWQLGQLAGGVEDIAGVAVATEQARVKTAAYADHLGDILYALQRVLAGMIPGVTVRDLIEDGILQPTRDLLRSHQQEDVRLSIVEPDGDEFVMPFAAGHSLESQRRFRLRIEDSFSKWAYRNGLIYWSSDLANDERFTPHPRAAAGRDYNSMISVPIRSEDEVVAVFNSIFTSTDAFDEAELIYVRLIGTVIELVWQLAGPQIEEAAGDDLAED